MLGSCKFTSKGVNSITLAHYASESLTSDTLTGKGEYSLPHKVFILIHFWSCSLSMQF